MMKKYWQFVGRFPKSSSQIQLVSKAITCAEAISGDVYSRMIKPWTRGVCSSLARKDETCLEASLGSVDLCLFKSIKSKKFYIRIYREYLFKNSFTKTILKKSWNYLCIINWKKNQNNLIKNHHLWWIFFFYILLPIWLLWKYWQINGYYTG